MECKYETINIKNNNNKLKLPEKVSIENMAF